MKSVCLCGVWRAEGCADAGNNAEKCANVDDRHHKSYAGEWGNTTYERLTQKPF